MRELKEIELDLPVSLVHELVNENLNGEGEYGCRPLRISFGRNLVVSSSKAYIKHVHPTPFGADKATCIIEFVSE